MNLRLGTPVFSRRDLAYVAGLLPQQERSAPLSPVWYSQFHALQLNQLPNNDVANLGGVAASSLLLEAGQMSWSGKHLVCASWVTVMIYDFK